MQAWFQTWFDSEYYHKLYNNRNEEEAITFVEGIYKELNLLPGARVLDVGCGKGRHSRALAAKGMDVTGIDLSPSSILAANLSKTSNLNFRVHDMRQPIGIHWADCVVNLFTSFGYFTTHTENQQVIGNMSAALKTGGSIIIDYLNVDYAEARSVSYEKRKIGSTQFTIRRWTDKNYFYKHIEVTDKHLKTPIEHTEQVAKFRINHFDSMLYSHQLQLMGVYGDYNFSSYDKSTSPRMIMVAKKTVG